MRSMFVNLPVRNLKASKAFFAELGFTFDPELSDAEMACMVIDQNAHVYLLSQDRFWNSVNGEIGCQGSAGEVLTCLSVESEEEVDHLLGRALAAGARPWPVMARRPAYSASFQDLDGHLWELVALPRGQDTPACHANADAVDLETPVPRQPVLA
jgi:predicted lactoylglutathione lyase